MILLHLRSLPKVSDGPSGWSQSEYPRLGTSIQSQTDFRNQNPYLVDLGESQGFALKIFRYST